MLVNSERSENVILTLLASLGRQAHTRTRIILIACIEHYFLPLCAQSAIFAHACKCKLTYIQVALYARNVKDVIKLKDFK